MTGRIRSRALALVVLVAMALIAAAGALAVAVPTTAPAASSCTQHAVSYIAHGKYSTATNPELAPGTWSGDLWLFVTSANRHFKKATTGVIITRHGTVYEFPSVTNAKVKFSAAVKSQVAKLGSLQARDHVTVTGTLLVKSGKGCTAPNVVTINHIKVSSKTGK